jgi:protein-tyrosine kinase
MSTSNDGDGAGRSGGRGQMPRVIDTTAQSETKTTELIVRRETLPILEREAHGDASMPLASGIANGEQLDAFRELRTRLLAMAAATGRTHFITLVVGVTPGSGASFVARNLAVAFTLQDQQYAILVDCNLRHPSQHRALGTAGEDGGLFEFLDKPHADADRLVRPTPIPGLHLIPA